MTADAAVGPRLVTISATYGAGGSLIAPMLAQRLGLPFADRLLAPAHAEARSQERATHEELEEEPPSPVLKSLALLSAAMGFGGPQDVEDNPDRIRQQIEVSLGPLLESGAVILGRAAAIAIGDGARAFHVRLDGPRERRARRGSIWEGVELSVARARLDQTDAARTRYLQRIYGRDARDPSLYHLMIDSTSMGVEPCADVIAAAAAAAWSFDDEGLETDLAKLRPLSPDPDTP